MTVTDTVGAGDTFTAGLLAALSRAGLLDKTALAAISEDALRAALTFAARAAAVPGATFAALCLVTGAIWGRPTWGTWWQWDGRLTSLLLLFFVYLGFIALLIILGISEVPRVGKRLRDELGTGARAEFAKIVSKSASQVRSYFATILSTSLLTGVASAGF